MPDCGNATNNRRCSKHDDLPHRLAFMQIFNLSLPLDQVAEAYRAIDERRALKTLLRP